ATGGIGGGAGIGGGWRGNGGSVTINGGSVTANGEHGAAGIGAGWQGTGGSVTITGGSVSSFGGEWGAGIGGGYGSGTTAGTIVITGENTTVTAMKGPAEGTQQDIGRASGGLDGDVFVAVTYGNLKGTSGAIIGNSVKFTADPSSGGIVNAALPSPFSQTVSIIEGLTTAGKSLSVQTTITDQNVLFSLSGYPSVSKSGNDLAASGVSVNFIIEIYGISLSQTGTYDFGTATAGYSEQTARTVTVENTGNQPTGDLTIALSGTNSSSFILSKTSIDSLGKSGSGTFTVRPDTGLAVGTYSATVTVSGGPNITAQSFNVSFRVNPVPTYGIALNPYGPIDFGTANLGYSEKTASTITVSNTGNQPTGGLTIALSGADPGSFTLSRTSIGSLDESGSNTFTVRPNTGLAVGTYSATVTVSGGANITAQSFDVSFEVTPIPTYGISLSPSGPQDFGTVNLGYSEQTARTVTVENTGNQPTGVLSIALSGTNPGSFTLSKISIGSLGISGSDTFTVRPNTGLPLGTYSATVTVSGGANITAQSFNVSFEVIPVPTYGISLSQTGTYTFKSATLGYSSQTPQEVTVSNTGNQPTGVLSIALSGADQGSFTLSKTSIGSLGISDSDTFTVRPNTGLAVGTYSATVTVSGGANITAQSFDVSFEVTPVPTYGISLSQTGIFTFGPAIFGYSPLTAHTVTVKNTGNQPTGDLTIALSGTNSDSFILSRSSISSLGVSGTDTFTVRPDTGLAVGTYSATVTVSGGNGISENFPVTFTVNPIPVYSVSLSPPGPIDFGTAIFGYPSQAAQTVTVGNTGNQPTGNLTIALSGTNPGSFALSKTSIGSLGLSGEDTFTVNPNTGLAVGTYSATVTVSGGNGISASFSVSFKVNPVPTYGVSLTPPGSYDFGAVIVEYSPQAAHTVKVSNTGNQPTGSLSIALSGSDPGSFSLSKTSFGSILVGGYSEFEVVPIVGLSVGTYSATVTVSGENGISAGFNVSFEVKIAPTYGISLAPSGPHTFPSMAPGYSSLTSHDVTVSNTGNQPTGNLTIALSGTNSSSFTLSKTSISSMAAGEDGTFSVVPKTGLTTGTYTATVTVSGGSNITAQSFNVSFEVTVAPTYGISLSQTGTKVFDPATFGYPAPARLDVTVTNTGNQPTGDLTVGVTGAGFNVSPTTVGSIATGGTGTFSVAPNTGLSVGVHSAAITVTGSNGISESFNVSFEVTPVPTYGISLSQTGTYPFAPLTEGYDPPGALTVTVTNTGNQPTGPLTIALSGAGSSGFSTTVTSIGSIASGTAQFDIAPAIGLSEGVYIATVTVSGGPNISTQSFNVSLRVDPIPTYGIEISQKAAHIFTPETEGYSSTEQLSVIVTNTGNQTLDSVAIALVGTNAASFILSATGISNLPAGGTGTFDLAPVTGLTPGTYTATVLVSSDKVPGTQSFNVSFTVNPTPTYGIDLSQKMPYSFSSADVGYSAPSALSVMVTNTGNQPTGALTIAVTGANASSFALSATSMDSIAAGSNNSFTVRPVTGLSAGSYTATVEVSGGQNIAAQSFTVNFTVIEATAGYGISLSQKTPYTFNATYGYSAQGPLTIMVTNTGSTPTGALSLTLSGADADKFSLSPASLGSIATGGVSTFTVAPVIGLTPGTYTATVTVGNSNVDDQSFTVSFIVAKKMLVWSQGEVYAKTYDGSTSASIRTSPVLSGFVGSDTVNVTAGTAAFADANAGINKRIIASGWVIWGGQSACYDIKQPSFAGGTIYQKEITFTGTVTAKKAYDGTINFANSQITISNAGSFSGKIGNDDVLLSKAGVTGTFGPEVGTGILAVFGSFSLTGAASGNYVLAEQPVVHAEITESEEPAGTQIDMRTLLIMAGLILLAILALLLLWMFLRRRSYEVVKTETAARIIGRDKARAKRPYTFSLEGGISAEVSYMVGDKGEWKALVPDESGLYAIPKEDVIDKITIECR
ncbi:MAG: choice-of-anchor D domain-containing protein, partial [Methanomassiliicoccaceae archaeon]|nr:choice-of-anchor D domain-containing protein [Methanomassiliicoccaceae archaeon]